MKKEEENKPNNNRRDFIKTSAIAAAGFMIVPRHVLGRGFVAPSDRLVCIIMLNFSILRGNRVLRIDLLHQN